jgi:hypothetical protein
MVFSCIIACAIQYSQPEAKVLLSSVLSPNQRYLWLEMISLSNELLLIVYLWSYVFLFLLACVTFSRTIERCITAISYDEENIIVGNIHVDLIYVQKTTKFYCDLKTLVHDFDYLCGWVIFLQLSGALALCCAYSYLLLKYWSVTSFYQLLSYLVLLCFFAILFCTTYPLLGVIYDKTVEFKQSWMRGIVNGVGTQGKICPRIVLKLESCYPFGFTAGNLFIFRTYTMLTCLSALSTYIIIMLQLVG